MELHPMIHAERPAGRALYRRAFPARERQSWSELERLQKEGRAEILTVDDGGFPRPFDHVYRPGPDFGRLSLAILPQQPQRRPGHRRAAGRPRALRPPARLPGDRGPRAARRAQPGAAPPPAGHFYLRNGIVPIAKMRVYDTDMELLATDESVTLRGLPRHAPSDHGRSLCGQPSAAPRLKTQPRTPKRRAGLRLFYSRLI